MSSAVAFRDAVTILSELVEANANEIDDLLKFASDALSLYLIHAENEGVKDFSEVLFRNTIIDLLETDAHRKENEDRAVAQRQLAPGEESYEKLVYRKRRGSVSANADPFAPLADHPKEPEVFEFLYGILKNTRLITRTMNRDQMKRLVATMHAENTTEGEQLITQGDYGKTMYLIESGEFQIVKDGIPSALLGKNALFGEISLLYSFPRTASVICTKDARVWVANSDAYTAILLANQRKNRETICQVLGKSEKYTTLTVEEKDRVLRTTHLMHFSKDECVDVPEAGLFMVLSPVCQVRDGEGFITLSQGDLLRKGVVCTEYTAFLFIPECSYAILSIT
ncbi:cAMP-dependent protein kinase regulator [Nematocida displodere]|uniref:cAMP-dependent protein kinase regulator n=1 Tax=Nematocida displodere TaxID=1805483 RepID=A0A177EKH1_9MICR|nr:cAMP-dependent protein kinase regulator [Nematocida displodere]